MSQTADMIIQLSTVLYFSGMAGYLFFLFKQKDNYQRIAFGLTSSAVGCHFISMVVYSIATGHLPIQNLSQSLSMAALFLGIMFVFFQFRFDLKIMGVFASVLLSAIMLVVWVLPQSEVVQNPDLKGFWFWSHIVLVFCGNAALALACGAGILYLLQENAIKTKKPGFFFKRLPSLDLLDNVGYTCMTTGFAMLTVGLVTGFIYAKSLWGKFWSGDIKEVFSMATWLTYAILLHFRYQSGWRGRKSAIMTIIGFIIVVFTFLGVNLLFGGHHQEFTK